MKIVTIEKLSYKVLELTPRSKKVKKVEFTFTIEGKEYKECSNDLSKNSLNVTIPFVSDYMYSIYFNIPTYNSQIEILNELIEDYSDYEYVVGSAGNLLLELDIEKGIKTNIKKGENVNVVPDTCFSSKGIKDMYTVFPKKTKFHKALINYYTMGFKNQDFSIDEFFSMRKLKLKTLNKNFHD